MTTTRRAKFSSALALTLAVLAGAPLAGCGGGTKTVTASGAAVPSNTTPASTTDSTHTTTPARTHTATTTTGASHGTGDGGTHTAPEPAFAEHGTGSGEATGAEAASAVAVIKSHGYTPEDTSEYHPHQTLRVLVGTRTGSADGYDQRAFFFLDGRYIGTDTSQPSASIRVVSQGDTEVTLAYPLYRPHDPLCCPGGGQATVHFQLDNGKLTPLDPIPPFSSQTGTSRQ